MDRHTPVSRLCVLAICIVLSTVASNEVTQESPEADPTAVVQESLEIHHESQQPLSSVDTFVNSAFATDPDVQPAFHPDAFIEDGLAQGAEASQEVRRGLRTFGFDPRAIARATQHPLSPLSNTEYFQAASGNDRKGTPAANTVANRAKEAALRKTRRAARTQAAKKQAAKKQAAADEKDVRRLKKLQQRKKLEMFEHELANQDALRVAEQDAEKEARVAIQAKAEIKEAKKEAMEALEAKKEAQKKAKKDIQREKERAKARAIAKKRAVQQAAHETVQAKAQDQHERVVAQKNVKGWVAAAMREAMEAGR